MRFDSVLPKMESKLMATKLSLDDAATATADASTEATQTPPAGDALASASRITGKRTTRDDEEPTEMYGIGAIRHAAHGQSGSGGRGAAAGTDHRRHQSSLDMSNVSSLCHELMERKRLLLSQAPSPHGGGDHDNVQIKASDEDSDGNTKGKSASSPNALKHDKPMNEEDAQKRKAQRRREQVRAASRRCRDRQRRETEELRVKVFQLEDFISHTMQAYEAELRRQRQQMEMLQHENESLRARAITNNDNTPPSSSFHHHQRPPSESASSPASVGSMSLAQSLYGVKTEPPVIDHASAAWTEEASHVVWDPVRTQNMHETVEDFKRALISIKNSTAPPAIRRQAFGWKLDFWAEDTQYFAMTRKFFRGMRARDVAERNFNVDYVKYIDTFPEVKEKKILHHLSSSVHIIRTVKDLPGKGLVSSLAATVLSQDEHFEGNHGERWVVGIISVGATNHVTFSHEDECNGYIFEDATRITSDGRVVHGCLVTGAGRYQGKGQNLNLLMEELAKIFASVVIRWESLFINDFMADDDAVVDEIGELEF